MTLEEFLFLILTVWYVIFAPKEMVVCTAKGSRCNSRMGQWTEGRTRRAEGVPDGYAKKEGRGWTDRYERTHEGL